MTDSFHGTSAVVLCRNYGRYLRQCLASLVLQTRPFDEIILVDNGSTDETAEIWSRYFRETVAYIRGDFGSQQAGRNAGFSKSRGKYLFFMDADDWIAPDFHEKMLAPHLKDPDLGFAYCGHHLVYDTTDTGWFHSKKHFMRPFSVRRLWYANYLSTPVLLRREIWQDIKDRKMGYPLPGGSSYGEDWEAWLTAAEAGWRGELVNERLHYYRLHGSNTSNLSRESLRSAAQWDIRRRHSPYDLCVVIPFSGQTMNEAPVLRQLQRLELPERTQVVFVDGSTRPIPGRAKSLATHYLRVTHLNQSYPLWRVQALAAAQPFVRARRVFIFDEFSMLRRDSWKILDEGMTKTRADFYSGRIGSRKYMRPMAWRAVGGNPARGIFFSPVIRRSRRVFATGLQCILMSDRAFHGLPFGVPEEEKHFRQWFLEAGFRAWQEGLRWFVDGRVRARFPDMPRPAAESTVIRGPFTPLREPPHVSIVIPAYNARTGVRRLLESLELLRYPKERLEIIVVDNGSSDGTAAETERFSGVTVLKERRRSSYAARNRGIRECRHDLIAFLDADCIVTPDWLTDLTAAMAAHPGAGAIAGDNRPENTGGFWSRMERRAGGYRNFEGSRWNLPYAITMNVLYRREVFESIGLFDETEISGSDVDFSWRMQATGLWELKILAEAGLVIHRDVETLAGHIKRQIRIGQGLFGFYQKHPASTPPGLKWMPRGYAELTLSFLKSLTIALVNFVRSGQKAPAAETWFEMFRRFLHQWGYLARARRQGWGIPRKKKKGAGFRVAYFSASYLTTDSPLYARLYGLADDGIPVLQVAAKKSTVSSWARLISSLAGLTTAWNWRPNLAGLEWWNLVPRGKSPGLEGCSRALNAWRIRKHLRHGKGELILAAGSLPAEELAFLRDALGQDALPAPRNMLEPPPENGFSLAACFVPCIDETLDLEAYALLSQRSEWPVVVAGGFSRGGLSRIAKLAAANPNLYFIPTRNVENTCRRLGGRLGAAVYLWKSAPPAGIEFPASLTMLAAAGLPVLMNVCREKESRFPAFFHSGRYAEIERRILKCQTERHWKAGADGIVPVSLQEVRPPAEIRTGV